jgi:hypothetical protein
MTMPNLSWFLTLLVVLVIVGAIVFIVDHLPIDATFKLVAKVVAIVGLAVWLILEVRGFVT